jgi:hypothetical protein
MSRDDGDPIRLMCGGAKQRFQIGEFILRKEFVGTNSKSSSSFSASHSFDQHPKLAQPLPTSSPILRQLQPFDSTQLFDCRSVLGEFPVDRRLLDTDRKSSSSFHRPTSVSLISLSRPSSQVLAIPSLWSLWSFSYHSFGEGSGPKRIFNGSPGSLPLHLWYALGSFRLQ